jgi:tetratricopeptide (TPR) repeat protein
MRLVLYAGATLAGLALVVVSLLAALPVATLIFGLLVAVCGGTGLLLRRRSRPTPGRADFSRGAALAEQGDRAGAEAAYRRAVESGDPEAAPAAAVNLGALHEEAGDLDAALASYRVAAGSGHPRLTPIGHLRIGTVLARRKELPAAEEHARQALASPPGEHTVAATILLASVAQRAGKPDTARAAAAELAASDNPQHAAAGRAYQAIFAVAAGDASAANLETLRASSEAGDQLTGTFLSLIEQATQMQQGPTEPSAETPPESGTARG